jgi:hypothetical protein
MNAIVLAQKASDWSRLKALVLDSVSSPITKRVYNLGLDEFFQWFGLEPRPGFTKATVSAWRVTLEARGLGSISINVRITAVRKLAVEADNGLLAPELAAGIARIKGVRSKGVRLGNWLSMRQAQTLLNTPDATTKKGRSSPYSWAADCGGPKWHLGTFSSGWVGGASWTWSANTAVFARYPSRRGSSLPSTAGLRRRV